MLRVRRSGGDSGDSGGDKTLEERQSSKSGGGWKTGKENYETETIIETEEASHSSKQDNPIQGRQERRKKEAGQKNRFKNHSFLNASLENMDDHLLRLERNG